MKKNYRNVLRTKKMIRNAFVELLREKKNMEVMTVSELAERADISKSTFYNHYEDIYSVVEEFEDELISNLSKAFIEIKQNNDEFLLKVIDFIKENEDMYRVAIMSSEIRFFIDKLKNIISNKLFLNDLNLSLSKDEKERFVQIRFITNACVDTIVDYLRGKLNLSLDEVSKIIISMLNKYK